MSANAIDITTLADVKTWLSQQGNTIGTTDDALLQRLITAASRFMLKYIDYPTLITSSYSDIFDGNGIAKSRSLRYKPVTAITSVIVGGVTIPQSPDRIASGWYLATDPSGFGKVYLIGCAYEFCKGTQNCAITYQAGFADQAHIPEDLQQVCIELVALKYKRRTITGLVSQSVGGVTTTSYLTKDMSDESKGALDLYRRFF